MDRRIIEVTIPHHDKTIELCVTYDYHKGSTSTMGDDPMVIEVISAIDGTKSDVLQKLTEDHMDYIEDEIYNDSTGY